MKLQNLIIIFIIIIIPIVIVFSYYLKLEAKTINMQTEYDEKLIEATREGMEAFIIDTTELPDEYSTLTNDIRRNLNSSINTFTTGLANKLGIGGTAKENILQYIPAVIYIMYDGYYIYTPSYIPQTYTDNNGKQIYYYENASGKMQKTNLSTQMIGDTLYAGKPIFEAKSASVAEGSSLEYLMTESRDPNNNTSTISKPYTTEISNAKMVYKHILKTFVPYSYQYNNNYTINFTLDNYVRIYGKDGTSKEGYILEDGETITRESNRSMTYKNTNKSNQSYTIGYESLTEYIPIDAEGNTELYPYIYNSKGEKRYYDSSTQRYFTLYGYTKQYLKEVDDTSEGEYQERYFVNYPQKYSLRRSLNVVKGTEISENYIWESDVSVDVEHENLPSLTEDSSAINYYTETYAFNRWLEETSGLDKNELLRMKRQAIIENIEENLNLSIANYNNVNSDSYFQLPKISEQDWDQALSNISMISFFQGVKVGLKTYNNYSVVSIAENNEFVNEDSLYYISSGDTYYHRFGCSYTVASEDNLKAYKSIDFKIKSCFLDSDEEKYYYMHGRNLQPCYDCIVNRNKLDTRYQQTYLKAFYHAIARERLELITKRWLTDSWKN